MENLPLDFLFNKQPEEIIKWFEGKGYAISWNWRDVWKEQHARAFTVAKVMKLDILQTLRNETERIFKEGTTYEEFYNNLETTLKRQGWWGKVKAKDVPGYDPNSKVDPDKLVQLGSPHRLKTIYQTNANVAYNTGRYDFMRSNVESRPYWQYKQIDRASKRVEHALYADKIFKWNDPIWNKIYPPNAFSCGCYVNALSESEVPESNISKGKDFAIEVSEGWDYNPAKEAFKPDLKKYDKDLVKQFVKDK